MLFMTEHARVGLWWHLEAKSGEDEVSYGGHWMYDSWDNPECNPWTNSMSFSLYLHIFSMLHFNDNEDVEGPWPHLIHKVWPLLNIVRRTLVYYANLGSEFSFDEGPMSCFIHYARHLIWFSLMKPTGTFHFKMHVFCCAFTHLITKTASTLEMV